MRYFEDLEIGAETFFGSYEVTREEVLDFARKYDPQPFHLSDEEAAKTHFGRLAASGWHTCAMTMAVIARHVVDDEQAGLGSPGVDELRWLKPVYPGDTLHVRGEDHRKNPIPVEVRRWGRFDRRRPSPTRMTCRSCASPRSS